MALPKLETPKHTCELPTLKTTVTFRPFLVGEQKMLLIAQESEDTNTQIREMMRLINVCCDDINVDLLPTIDLEYLFLQLRIKSVGETSDVVLLCTECDEKNTIEIDLETAEVIGEVGNNIIEITDSISLELQYPSYKMMENLNLADDVQDTGDLFKLISLCIVSIIDGDEIHTKDDFTEKELLTFMDSMSITMFEMIQEYFNSAPTLTLTNNYKCSFCDIDNNVELRGLGNFFV